MTDGFHAKGSLLSRLDRRLRAGLKVCCERLVIAMSFAACIVCGCHSKREALPAHDPVAVEAALAEAAKLLEQDPSTISCGVSGSCGGTLEGEQVKPALTLLKALLADLPGTERQNPYNGKVKTDVLLHFYRRGGPSGQEDLLYVDLYDCGIFGLWTPRLGPRSAVAYNLSPEKKEAVKRFFHRFDNVGKNSGEDKKPH